MRVRVPNPYLEAARTLTGIFEQFGRPNPGEGAAFSGPKRDNQNWGHYADQRLEKSPLQKFAAVRRAESAEFPGLILGP